MNKLTHDQIRQSVRGHYQEIAVKRVPTNSTRSFTESSSSCCNAPTITDLEDMLTQSGFTNISIEPKEESKAFIKDWIPGAHIDNYIVSAVIKATKL